MRNTRNVSAAFVVCATIALGAVNCNVSASKMLSCQRKLGDDKNVSPRNFRVKPMEGVYVFCVEPISPENFFRNSLHRIGEVINHEAGIEITCEEGHEYDAQIASTHSSMADWILVSPNRTLEESAVEAVNARDNWWSSGLHRCPLPEGFSNDTGTCFRSVSPFGKTCVAVKAYGSGEMQCKVSCAIQPGKFRPLPFGKFNVPRFLMFVAAIVLFYVAPSLAASAGFHYSVGVSVGVVASLMVVVYILSRSVNGRWSKMAVMVLGLTGNLSLLFYYAFNGPWYTIAFWRDYWQHALMYLGTAAAVSFATTYWMLNRSDGSGNTGLSGPGRTLLLLMLRSVAILMAYQSSATLLVSIVAMVIVSLWAPITRNVSEATSWIFGLGSYYVASKPKKCYLHSGKFLSEEAFSLQKQRTTNTEMRKLCNSPAFQKWMRRNMTRVRVVRPGEDEGD
eukprot:g1158.t1